MKKISLLVGMLSLCVAMHAAGTWQYDTTVFRPNDGEGDTDDVFDLDHHYAYTWGVTGAVTQTGWNSYGELKNQVKAGTGWSVVSVTLTFKDIWDWVVEPNDRLWVNLIDTNYKPGGDTSGRDLKKGVKTFEDNADDIESTNPGSNYFNGQGIGVGANAAPTSTTGGNGYWTDQYGGNDGANKKTVVFTFTATQMSTLVSYINNGGATSGSTGYADFGFAFDPDCHYYNTGIEMKVVTKRYFVPDGGTTVALVGVGFLALVGLRRYFRR